MAEDFPNKLVVSDSSKVASGSLNSYDIKTFKNKSSHALSMIGSVLTAAQLASLISYLRLLGQASSATDSVVPKLLLAANIIEYTPNIADLAVSLTGQLLCKQGDRPIRRIYGDDVPGVDIIITTCKEDCDVVMDTVRGAATLDWPSDKLRVLVSDDGPDPKLGAAVEELKSRYSHVHYYSRPKIPGKHHGFKAGNMNQAMRYLASDAFDGPANDWAAALDADMIPHPNFLRALMPHVLVESDIAMITTPQDFYNIPVNDPLHDNLALQHEAEQSFRDKMGSAWCPGSGFLFHRPAWHKIGGFSETSICDDILFGWTLNGKGYKTASINERLQQGMQPSGFVEHMKQRRRWHIGGMRNANELKFGLTSKIHGNSSAWQKLAAMNQIPKPYFSTIGKFVSLLLIFMCIISGQEVVDTTEIDLAYILGSYALFVVASRISEYKLANAGFGIQNIRRRQIVGVWQGIHLTKAALQELIPAWLGGYSLPFVVTGQKIADEVTLEERDSSKRPGFFTRIYRLHQLESVLVHLFIFVAMTTALLIRGAWLYLQADGQTKRFIHALIVSMLFPGMRIENVACFLSPVWYIMFPPTEKPREQYLMEDPDTGVRRPLPRECGAKFTRGMYVWEAWYLAATAWAVGAWLFVAKEAGLV